MQQLWVYDGSWSSFEQFFYTDPDLPGVVDARFPTGAVVYNDAGRVFLDEGDGAVLLPGNHLGPTSDDRIVTIETEPGWVHVHTLDRQGELLETVSEPVLDGEEVVPRGVIDNGTVDAFVMVLGAWCPDQGGELWRFTDGELERVMPTRLGALHPSRSPTVFADDILDDEGGLRAITDGEIDENWLEEGWLDSRALYGIQEQFPCTGRCVSVDVPAPAVDPAGGLLTLTTIDQVDLDPQLHLKKVPLPHSFPFSEATPPAAPGFPLVDLTVETADLDDPPPYVRDFSCLSSIRIEEAPDFRAYSRGSGGWTVEAPGYNPIGFEVDAPSGSVVLNRGGQPFMTTEPEFSAFSTPGYVLVAGGATHTSYVMGRFGVGSAIDPPAHPITALPMRSGSLYYGEDGFTYFYRSTTGGSFRVDLVEIDLTTIERHGSFWLYNNQGRTKILDTASTLRSYSTPPSVDENLAPDADSVTRVLMDGSVTWERLTAGSTPIVLHAAGWADNGNRVWPLARAGFETPLLRVERNAVTPASGHCLQEIEGCTLTYNLAGVDTVLSTDATHIVPTPNFLVWADSEGVHKHDGGGTQTSTLGLPDEVHTLQTMVASRFGQRWDVFDATTWPMTLHTTYDAGDQGLDIVQDRYMVLSPTGCTDCGALVIDVDAPSAQLSTATSVWTSLSVPGVEVVQQADQVAFDLPYDSEWVFARGDRVGFPTEPMFMPPCFPYSEVLQQAVI